MDIGRSESPLDKSIAIIDKIKLKYYNFFNNILKYLKGTNRNTWYISE